MSRVKSILNEEIQTLLFLDGEFGKKAIYALFGKVMLAKQLELIDDNETSVYLDLLFDALKKE